MLERERRPNTRSGAELKTTRKATNSLIETQYLLKPFLDPPGEHRDYPLRSSGHHNQYDLRPTQVITSRP